MKTFFKNTRHKSTDIAEVIAKRKHEDINENLQTNKGAASAFGIPNYMPAFNQGEGAFPVLAHVEELQKQYNLNKNRKIAPLIKRLMDKTFPDRCNMFIK